MLGETILRNTDNLSKTLQHQHLSAAEGQRVASLTVETLERIRTDECFDLFWCKVLKRQQCHDISEPEIKTPRRYEFGESSGDFHETAKSYYQQQYFEVLDFIVRFIKERFNQPGYATYTRLRDLLKAATGISYESDLQYVTNFYGTDLNKYTLDTQLQMLATLYANKDKPVKEIVDQLRSMSCAEQTHFSELVNVVKLILIMPATSAVSERSASALRRIKTYLRTSMTQLRMNNLMVLHVHKENLDKLSLVEVAKDFVSQSKRRLTLFGSLWKVKCFVIVVYGVNRKSSANVCPKLNYMFEIVNSHPVNPDTACMDVWHVQFLMPY